MELFLRSREEFLFNTDRQRPSLETGLSTFLWNRPAVWKWNTKLYDYIVYNVSKRTDFFFVFSVSVTWCLLYIYILSERGFVCVNVGMAYVFLLAVCKWGLRMLIQVWMLYVYVDTYVSTFPTTCRYTCPGFVSVGCSLYLYKMDNGAFLLSREEVLFNTDCPSPLLETGLSIFLWNCAVIWNWNCKLYDYMV